MQAEATLPTKAETPYSLLSPRFDIAQKLAFDMADLSILLDLPMSTLNKVLDEHPAPTFLLGRKRYIAKEDAIQWLRDVAAANPHTKRQNNSQK